MRRRQLMVELGVGAALGVASGFAYLAHGGYGPFGHGGHWGRRADFERRVADTCTESALRVYREEAPKPGQVP